MSTYIRRGAKKLPTVLGGGILGVALVGVAAMSAGLALPLMGEILSAAVGMAVASRFA